MIIDTYISHQITTFQYGGYWVATCELKGLSGIGDTEKEAVSKLKEAIDMYYEIKKENA